MAELRRQLHDENEDSVFEVERIKDIRLWGGKIEYLVKWANTTIDNTTLTLVNQYLFAKNRDVTVIFNTSTSCREMVWTDSWVEFSNLDCHELVMQFHIDAKNSLKDEVSSLTQDVKQLKEENARLKVANDSLKHCVTSKQKR